jgi:hypothetical protein
MANEPDMVVINAGNGLQQIKGAAKIDCHPDVP